MYHPLHSIRLLQRFDVIENAKMNPANNYVGPQQPRFVPNRYRLYERSGGEFAISHRPFASAFNARLHRFGETCSKIPFLRLFEIGKCHYVSPYSLRRGGDFNFRSYREIFVAYGCSPR